MGRGVARRAMKREMNRWKRFMVVVGEFEMVFGLVVLL